MTDNDFKLHMDVYHATVDNYRTLIKVVGIRQFEIECVIPLPGATFKTKWLSIQGFRLESREIVFADNIIRKIRADSDSDCAWGKAQMRKVILDELCNFENN